MIVYYARVSTIEQNEGRQVEAAKLANADKVFIDKASGKSTEGRPQLKAMLDFVREGDTVLVSEFSRLARSTRDLLAIVDTLTDKGVKFVSQKEAVDTSTPQGRFVLTIFAALSELERETILQRQKEGIQLAKSQGKYRGRKPIEIDTARFNSVVERWRNGEITAVKAQELTGLTASTFYRRIRTGQH